MVDEYVLDQTSGALCWKHLDQRAEQLGISDSHGVVVLILVRVDQAQDGVC